mmetsp:Transcript_146963/g.366553  ORF Transcript_146963/g.366553 Transcript_146963/m.366553 type:complete len:264 (-) Transcript_146963:219-1010(-)
MPGAAAASKSRTLMPCRRGTFVLGGRAALLCHCHTMALQLLAPGQTPAFGETAGHVLEPARQSTAKVALGDHDDLDATLRPSSRSCSVHACLGIQRPQEVAREVRERTDTLRVRRPQSVVLERLHDQRLCSITAQGHLPTPLQDLAVSDWAWGRHDREHHVLTSGVCHVMIPQHIEGGEGVTIPSHPLPGALDRLHGVSDAREGQKAAEAADDEGAALRVGEPQLGGVLLQDALHLELQCLEPLTRAATWQASASTLDVQKRA